MRPVPTPLDSIPLFADISAAERAHVAQLMTPFFASAGSTLFREGDRGDELYVIQSGRLEAARRSPGGTDTSLALLGPGVVIGEMALMGNGARTATVTALEDTHGLALRRAAFEVLAGARRRESLTLMRRIGDVAIIRLRDRYAAIAEELQASPAPFQRSEPPIPIAPEPGELGYLRGTLFFSGLSHEETAEVLDGVRRISVSRGALLLAAGEAPPALYVVARGAVESTIRGATHVHRVRLAGPGRVVGHLGVLGPAPSVVECRARERAVVLELRWERVSSLLEGHDAASRGFAAALNKDVVRAVLQAERPMTHMALAPGQAPALVRSP